MSFLLLFLDSRNLLGVVKSPFLTVFIPVEGVVYSLKNSVYDSVSILTFWKSGERRIKNLEQKNLELTANLVDYTVLKRENQELRNELGVKKLADFRKLTARVYGSGKELSIGAGKKEGVMVGQTVVYLDNYVGQIKSVGQSVSFVELPTDSGAKISVKVGPSQAVSGIVTGQFDSSMILSQVAQNEDLNVSDLVATAGEGETVSGLVVGKVVKITSSEKDIFKTAVIAPLINFSRLSTVFVIIR